MPSLEISPTSKYVNLSGSDVKAISTQAYLGEFTSRGTTSAATVQPPPPREIVCRFDLLENKVYIYYSEGVSLPSWLHVLIGSAFRLLVLPKDWDSYGGQQVVPKPIEAAIRLLSLFMTDKCPLPSLVPTSAGGVQIEWHTKGVDLEIEIAPDGSALGQLDEGGRLSWEGRPEQHIAELRGLFQRL
jgi:hypothetical protein